MHDVTGLVVRYFTLSWPIPCWRYSFLSLSTLYDSEQGCSAGGLWVIKLQSLGSHQVTSPLTILSATAAGVSRLPLFPPASTFCAYPPRGWHGTPQHSMGSSGWGWGHLVHGVAVEQVSMQAFAAAVGGGIHVGLLQWKGGHSCSMHPGDLWHPHWCGWWDVQPMGYVALCCKVGQLWFRRISFLSGQEQVLNMRGT